MPRLPYRAIDQNLPRNQNGALPTVFVVGYGHNHGNYLQVDLTKPDQTLRQEICDFVGRRYNVQVINKFSFTSTITHLCLKSKCPDV